MKYTSFFFLIILCLATVPASFAQNSPAPMTGDNRVYAATIMDQYFLALTSGDTASLETLLGGRLLEKRKKLLGNPAYSGYLKKTYQDANFKILNYKSNRPDSVTVEVLITLAESETVRKNYRLERTETNSQQPTLVIVSETTIAEPL